jgi:hypothetical protein
VDGYAVKVSELGKLIDDLGTAADKMADANRKLGGGGAFGSLGTAELGQAGVEFEEAWGYGIGRLGEAASEVSDRLKQAKQKYERIEAEFGGELSKFGSAVLGAGGSPAGDGGMVGGGVMGGVPGVDKSPEPDGGMVGGGATGGITDILNGLGR